MEEVVGEWGRGSKRRRNKKEKGQENKERKHTKIKQTNKQYKVKRNNLVELPERNL